MDFLLDAVVQRARRHAADAGRHHQRTARAAGLLRRRAPVRRHLHHPHDVVRRRRRRARRDRTRLAVSRVCRPRRSTPRSSTPTRASAKDGRRASEANIGRPAVTGRLEYVGVPGPDGRRQRLVRPLRLRVPPAVRRAGDRSPKPMRGTRAVGSSCAAQFAQVGIDNAGAAQRRAAAARSASIRTSRARCAGSTLRRRLPRLLRRARSAKSACSCRYENFDTQFRMPAGYLPLHEFDRDAWVVGANLLARPRHRGEGRLLDRPQSERASSSAPNSFNVGLGWWF